MQVTLVNMVRDLGRRRTPSSPPAPRLPRATRTWRTHRPGRHQPAGNRQPTEQLTGAVRQSVADSRPPAGRQLAELGVTWRARRRGGGQVVRTMAEIDVALAEDRQHHQRHRRHRLPDQHPGAQRRGGSRPGRRAGPRLCRGGLRCAALAQRSADAAGEIKGLIGASVEKVEHASRAGARAGHTIQESSTAYSRVSDIIGEGHHRDHRAGAPGISQIQRGGRSRPDDAEERGAGGTIGRRRAKPCATMPGAGRRVGVFQVARRPQRARASWSSTTCRPLARRRSKPKTTVPTQGSRRRWYIDPAGVPPRPVAQRLSPPAPGPRRRGSQCRRIRLGNVLTDRTVVRPHAADLPIAQAYPPFTQLKIQKEPRWNDPEGAAPPAKLAARRR